MGARGPEETYDLRDLCKSCHGTAWGMVWHGAACTRPRQVSIHSALWPYFNVRSYVSDLSN